MQESIDDPAATAGPARREQRGGVRAGGGPRAAGGANLVRYFDETIEPCGRGPCDVCGNTSIADLVRSRGRGRPPVPRPYKSEGRRRRRAPSSGSGRSRAARSADGEGVPAYIVFSDAVLARMGRGPADRRKAGLLAVSGVGSREASLRYGAAFPARPCATAERRRSAASGRRPSRSASLSPVSKHEQVIGEPVLGHGVPEALEARQPAYHTHRASGSARRSRSAPRAPPRPRVAAAAAACSGRHSRAASPKLRRPADRQDGDVEVGEGDGDVDHALEGAGRSRDVQPRHRARPARSHWRAPSLAGTARDGDANRRRCAPHHASPVTSLNPSPKEAFAASGRRRDLRAATVVARFVQRGGRRSDRRRRPSPARRADVGKRPAGIRPSGSFLARQHAWSGTTDRAGSRVPCSSRTNDPCTMRGPRRDRRPTG